PRWRTRRPAAGARCASTSNCRRPPRTCAARAPAGSSGAQSPDRRATRTSPPRTACASSPSSTAPPTSPSPSRPIPPTASPAAPAISPRREWRALEQHKAGRLGHDLHALGWAIALHRAVGSLATDNWRTPRYATGRYPVPQLGSGQRRHPITLNEIPVADGQAIIDIQHKAFTEVKPDLSLELRIDALKLTFDLLVELDLTARPSYNHDKLLAYDAFLCGW